MYKDYQKQKIYLYYTEQQEPLLKWAMSFWLLKSPHPLKPIKIDTLLPFNEPPITWLNKMLSQDPLEGLYVPLKVRPCVDIDLLEDSHKMNRYSLTKCGLPLICLQNKDSTVFDLISIDGVIKDLTDQTDEAINTEMQFMTQTLLMGL